MSGRLFLVDDRQRAIAILVVDVVAELDETFGCRPGGDVGPVDRKLLHRLRIQTLARADDVVDVLTRPFGALEDPGDEVANVLHTGTAGGVEAVFLPEYRFVRRVMHVDAVLVGDVDAHGAERVAE